MNKSTCATITLIPRQYDLVRDLFFESKGVLYPLIRTNSKTWDVMIDFLSNEDMFTIIDLIKEAGLWYGENDWKYYHLGR